MENCLEAKTDVDSVVISKDQMRELSQEVLYCLTDNMIDYTIPDNTSFLNFSETYQAILGNWDIGLLVFLYLEL